jgi:hypothetical protein
MMDPMLGGLPDARPAPGALHYQDVLSRLPSLALRMILPLRWVG